MTKAVLGSGLLGLALSLAIFLALPAAGAEAQSVGQPFSLEAGEEDGQSITRYKAALRIFGGVKAVYDLTAKCKAPSTLAGFERRNGNSISLVVKQFELGGGLGLEQRAAVNAYAEGQVREALSQKDCAALMADVDAQKWDVYKSERFQEDYEIVKGR
jgi:hypothetical protein